MFVEVPSCLPLARDLYHAPRYRFAVRACTLPFVWAISKSGRNTIILAFKYLSMYHCFFVNSFDKKRWKDKAQALVRTFLIACLTARTRRAEAQQSPLLLVRRSNSVTFLSIALSRPNLVFNSEYPRCSRVVNEPAHRKFSLLFNLSNLLRAHRHITSHSWPSKLVADVQAGC